MKNVVFIKDYYSNIMIEVLRFIYCSEVENLDVIAADLISAAEKYELDGLKEICIESLIKTLSVENVLKYLTIADRLGASKKLFNLCLNVITRFVKRSKFSIS